MSFTVSNGQNYVEIMRRAELQLTVYHVTNQPQQGCGVSQALCDSSVPERHAARGVYVFFFQTGPNTIRRRALFLSPDHIRSGLKLGHRPSETPTHTSEKERVNCAYIDAIHVLTFFTTCVR